MAQDHYRILGVGRNATNGDIKSAYRKLVLAHHPDKSPSHQSAEIFLKATEAYEILGDTELRRNYDGSLDMEKRRASQPRPQTQTQARPQPSPQQRATQKVSTIAADVTKLTLIFTRGQYNESETLARHIISKDSKQPIPYAVLGDIARAKGKLDEAAKMYASPDRLDVRRAAADQPRCQTIAQQRDHRRAAGADGVAVADAFAAVVALDAHDRRFLRHERLDRVAARDGWRQVDLQDIDGDDPTHFSIPMYCGSHSVICGM